MAKETFVNDQAFMICSRDDENDAKLFELADFVKKFGTVEPDTHYGEVKSIYFFTEKEKTRQLETNLKDICEKAGVKKTYDSSIMIKFEALFENGEPYKTLMICLPGPDYDRLLGSKNGSKVFEQRSVQVTVL